MTAAATAITTTATPGEKRYMPLKLKGVLAQNRIKQTDWCAAITQTGGKRKGSPLSPTSAALLLNWGQWPKCTPPDEIRRQTEEYLQKCGVPERDIAIVWQEDAEDEFRDAKPNRGTGKRASRRVPVDPDNTIQLPEAEMLNTTAKQHFKIFRDPFVDDVTKSEDVFLSTDQRYIAETMYQTAKHGGFIAVVGESGSGKTTLRRYLLERIQREHLEISVIQPRMIDKRRLTAGSICDAIINDISPRTTPRSSLEAKARQLEKLLTDSARAGNSHVLMIEEAHDLTIQTLKYLKRFWELEDGFRKLLSIILVGQPELRDLLDERQHAEAREVIRRCEIAELDPLNGNLEQYLALKFERVGVKLDAVFERNAFDALRDRLSIRRRGSDVRLSMLYPLVVNNAVTKAMNLAADIGAPKITAEIVMEV